ncbi:RNA polymerase sigma factor [Rhodoplanes sp. TEM]|uniref:RNA polymerase sigma factor n=1 Tax=Rhodoplanes tepidamans TaxID=200616 RepID=A0ABT5JBG9_RHOTP|nr:MULTISPECIES: RNA polymerase sigma factor [Rhodoplanes]MDC7787029.1 RNA polymerase sigma factor [Rhodoplanes tepidamans]MDC7985273.1 RNA polymerase sigma factor [Rhodoplanes sp. TEM]MDQ0354245.1 RNA polymerase sigma-70 factor (ECF subfamily) [Rhodoplanes tepidamans]
MTEGPPGSLRRRLAARYGELKRRLSRRLGSADLAGDVLHETYLRLDPSSDVAAIRRPEDYIIRVALNIASDHRRSDVRRLKYSEVEALYHLADASIDPERRTAARSELAALGRALETLTARQRAILIAVRVNRTPHAELARRFGVSERMVVKDLRRALEHCADQLERTAITRFGSCGADPPGEQAGSKDRRSNGR